jgi:hypothetical protein
LKENRSGSVPLGGMKRDLHISQLKETDVYYALNSNTESQTGDKTMHTNEPSNYLSTVFPTGYKVIGRKKHLQGNKTFYILTNPETKKSSIGYIEDIFIESQNEDEHVECDNCNGKNRLSIALEDITQTPVHQYIEIASDECHEVEEGMTLDINHPIKFISIKEEKGQVNLYWNDYYNSPRWLNTTNTSYLYTREIPCDDNLVEDCIIIDKLLQFPKNGSFDINPKTIQTGGSLKMGTYEFHGAYCDLYGNEISDYFTPTNPIPIFDENNNILSQAELDSYTNFAIKLDIQNLNTDYAYYKIVCVERNSVDGTESAFLEGIHPTTDNTVVYSSSGTTDDEGFITSGNKRLRRRVDISQLYNVKTKYTKAKGTAEINGKQFMWGLYKKPELNLQPVVNLFSSLAKWQTTATKEDLYKNAIACSKYKGYQRDEVQPFSLRFWFKDGGYTANLPFISRPASASERELVDVTNPNRASIEDNAPDCSTTERTEKWQFINTATNLGICGDFSDIPTQTVQETVSRTCEIEDPVATIPIGDSCLLINDTYVDLKTYIEENYELAIDPTSDYYIEEIAPFLIDTYPDDNCDPEFEGTCDESSLESSEVYIAEVIGEQTTLIEKCIDNYAKAKPPTYCNLYERNTTDGEYVQDVDFAKDYMGCNEFSPPASGGIYTVYKRIFNFYNEDCAYADDIINNLPLNQQGIPYFHNYYGGDTLNDVLHSSNKDALPIDSDFQDKLHKGALFFKIERNGRDKIIFELTKKSDCEEEDDLSIGDRLRYNFYSSCNNTTPLPITIVTPNNDGTNCPNLDQESCSYTPPTAGIIDMTEGLLVELDVSNYPSTFYVAVDSPITTENVPTTRTYGTLEWNCSGETIKYRTAPICGCFNILIRDVEYYSAKVEWASIGIGKKETYTSECSYEIPILGDCDPVPNEYGEFAYWESTEEYPDNEELYDSSNLTVTTEDLSLLSNYDKGKFEEYYSDGTISNTYILKDNTDFRCSKIRHPKLPDNIIAPFMSTVNVAPFSESIIYPLGIKLDPSVVKTMLSVALSNNLISQEDYDNIEGYEILRGDNTVSKSVLTSGLLYDMYSYQKNNNKHLYANFPHNDLGKDLLHYEDETRTNLIPHPYGSEKNNRFSFLSPDIFLTKPQIPTEMSISGYQIGNSSGRFVDVEDHPKWTILGSDARSLADVLSIAETSLELAIKVAEFITQGGQGNLWFIAGLATGTNAAGAGISTGALVTFIGASLATQFLKWGQYRYQWLQTFRDLGATYNFAGYNVSHGYHNKFIKNTLIYDDSNGIGDNEYLRGFSIRKYMDDGRYEYRDLVDADNKLLVNNWGREKSIFLSTGEHHLHYPINYKFHDNNTISPEQGSRTTMGDNGCSLDADYQRNVGSPYVSLKNYVPDQWGEIDNIKWLTTNEKISLDEEDSCRTIYGGTVYISRFTWKRKLPLFTTTAMGAPDKLAFNYSQYSNIGSPRFYCDYETDTIKRVIGVPFPDIDSEYNFDCVNGNRGFYVKPQSKLYLYYYGITDFLVESEINCNFRYGRTELKDSFYPAVGDIVRWTQQKNVPISEPNTFFYNNTYSRPVSNRPYKRLGSTFSTERQLILANQENATIWSEQDVDENSPVDPWLIFKPLNWYEFPYNYGELVELKGIEGGQVLARFEDRQLILNAVDNLADRVLPQTQDLGTGGIFSTRPSESNTSDLGFVGSQNYQTLSTPYGHVTIDAKRGKVHLTTAGNQEAISESVGGQPTHMKNWFREHLPFKILRSVPNADIDNNYKGLGITMGWDARHDRIFITKKDYIPKADNIDVCGNEFVITETSHYQDIIDSYTSQDYIYEGIEDCSLKFTKSAIPNTTDIYAFFDTTSMNVVDGASASTALNTWFSEYQSSNPSYTGNLYIIPYGVEDWVNYPNSLYTGTITPNLTGAWDNIDILPPNLNTPQWIPPTNLIVLAFVDESQPVYHSVALTDGFDTGIIQPTVNYQIHFNNFVNNYNNNFNFFKGVIYPIVQNIDFQGGSLVLQALAAIEGKLLTAQEIIDTNTTVNVSLLLSENPYIALGALKDYGWKGVYDKVTPASDVFNSASFSDELDELILGTEEAQIVYEPLEKVDLLDEEYFEDVSWTVAFKIGEGWISYYSFKPNYYSFHNEYFQIGYNYGTFKEKLWNHNLNQNSLQVFQGVKYPWTVEVPFKNQNVNKILKSLEINLEAKRYQNEWDYSQHKDIGFNKINIYNNTNNSGNLNLNLQKTLNDVNKYPITNNNGTQDILYTAENGKHYVNSFYNRIKNQDSNITQILWDKNRIEKTVNPQAVSFRGKPLLERMKGQQFIVRLIQDKESRYSITLKDVQTKEIIHD